MPTMFLRKKLHRQGGTRSAQWEGLASRLGLLLPVGAGFSSAGGWGAALAALPAAAWTLLTAWSLHITGHALWPTGKRKVSLVTGADRVPCPALASRLRGWAPVQLDHVLGDGAQRIQQLRLHPGFQDEQVHVDLWRQDRLNPSSR